MDIDAERHYWKNLNHPGRKLSHYGYVGLVLGFYLYYFFYSGTFKYYYSGVWNQPDIPINKLSSLLNPGFYLFNEAYPIPKFVASALTLGGFYHGKLLSD